MTIPNNALWQSLRTPEEIQQDEDEERERQMHEDRECWGDDRCKYCLEDRQAARDLDGMVEHVCRELDREKKAS